MTAILGALGGQAVSGIVKEVGSVIDDLVTTDEERAAGELELRKLDQQLQLGQQEINKEEAKHASLFVAGWRPFIGWVCGVALGLVYIPKALVMTGIWTYLAIRVVLEWNGIGMPSLPPFPDLGVWDLLGLVGSMLGMGTMRMAETLRGKARSEPLTPPPAIFRRKPPAEIEAP